MADAKNEVDVKEPRKGAAGGGQMKLVIVGALALFVALVGAQVAAPLINKALDAAPHAAADDEALEGEDAPEEEIVLAAAEPEHLDPAIYVSLDPPFVVSFQAPDGQHYLQLTLQAMTRTKKVIEAVQTHSPAIRNSFLLLLSSFDINTLDTVEGKQKLRAEMLQAANEILAQNRAPGEIEELYFTSLVTQ